MAKKSTSKSSAQKEAVNGHIASNKRAFHDYIISEKLEAGLVLQGTEVKSLRLGRAQITESYVSIDDSLEAWVENVNIPQYANGTYNNHAEKRKRKLLLHKKEALKLKRAAETKGMTIVATALYFKRGRAKLEIALAKGKHLFDKRETIKQRDIARENARDFKGKMK